MEKLEELVRNRVSRRKFLIGAGSGLGATAALALAAGCGGSSSSTTTTTTTPPASTGITDTDIFNFALNLEYLEAEFYLRAVTGSGLSAADAGTNPGTVTGGAAVPFKTPAKTFEIPTAPKLIAVAAIALPRTAAVTGLEQEKRKAAIMAGERKRMYRMPT